MQDFRYARYASYDMIQPSLMLKLLYHIAALNRIDDNDVESAV